MRLTLSILLGSIASAAVLVPEPTGPYDVAMKVQEVTDWSRPQDPLDNKPQPRGRRLLLSVFLPIDRHNKNQSCTRITIPYMTPLVAADYGAQAGAYGLPTDTYSQFNLQFCDLSNISPCNDKGCRRREFPVILFTPGLEESRLLYGAGARSLASQGYIVITIDHPYEAPHVEFPDGTVIVGKNMPDADINEPLKTKLMAVRTADISFVIDRLHDRILANTLFSTFGGSVNLGQMAVYAHSVGGSAAAEVARADNRLLGGLNFDGQVTLPIRNQGLRKPFMLAGRFNHTATDNTWNVFWPHLRGPRVWLETNGTQHASYTDRPLLVSALNVPPDMQAALYPLIGSIPGRRLESIVNDILVGFLDFVFYKDQQKIKELPSLFSEVTIPRINL